MALMHFTADQEAAIRACFRTILDGFKEQRDDFAARDMTEGACIHMSAYLNALLDEARHVAITMNGERYMYQLFLICALGKETFQSVKDVSQR